MALLNDQNQFTLFFLTKSAKKSRFSRGPLEAKMAKFSILSSPTGSSRADLLNPEGKNRAVRRYSREMSHAKWWKWQLKMLISRRNRRLLSPAKKLSPSHGVMFPNPPKKNFNFFSKNLWKSAKTTDFRGFRRGQLLDPPICTMWVSEIWSNLLNLALLKLIKTDQN